jgi:hypothetical protein
MMIRENHTGFLLEAPAFNTKPGKILNGGNIMLKY